MASVRMTYPFGMLHGREESIPATETDELDDIAADILNTCADSSNLVFGNAKQGLEVLADRLHARVKALRDEPAWEETSDLAGVISAGGILFAALVTPIGTSALRSPTEGIVAASGIVALLSGRVPPIVVVVASALLAQVAGMA